MNLAVHGKVTKGAHLELRIVQITASSKRDSRGNANASPRPFSFVLR